MIVELLFVKIVFLQLWYAYICFKSYNDQQRWIYLLLHFQLTNTNSILDRILELYMERYCAMDTEKGWFDCENYIYYYYFLNVLIQMVSIRALPHRIWRRWWKHINVAIFNKTILLCYNFMSY